MMMTTAGGPGPVHPLDFNERKRPRFSRATWIATGIVVAAHAGLGVALYYQRFEMPAVATPPESRPFEVTFRRPTPPEPLEAKTPPAPNLPVNETPVPMTPTDTLPAVPSDAEPTDSTALTFDTLVRDPAPDVRTAEPTPAPAAVITNPSWSRQPTPEQLMRAYPGRALTADVSGSASLNCLVLPKGNVTDCNVTRETPGGYGFGRAAQSLSRYFRINPRTVDGAAEGARVNIGLRFTLPED
ncbi:energy transducer TonB [Brevundimonas sp. Root1423]|uniref:energy transducer TonB family protein n=1 Tax=Brevundimonas sp. Root1423 TaxID=1736462 RepID=UPI000A4CB317|nr:energy transducer TonB [Brevundimonas sp. Root1423]